MNTLLLDLTTWDLVVDSANNIAMAADPYALAQNVATACRTFLNELWYNVNNGIPYLQQVLGKNPPFQFVEGLLAAQALTVTGVIQAKAHITGRDPNRGWLGTIEFIDSTGKANNVILN